MHIKYSHPVKEYWLICKNKIRSYDFHLLAVDSYCALMYVDRKQDWDEIILRKISNKVVAFAMFQARDVSDENPEEYLNYHCIPNEEKS